jgi:formylglycine-generating enzyme required for sulfatase activity
VSPPVPPTLVGRFELGSELGRGGMGIVVEARDPLLGRTVALKLLPDGGADRERAARFRHEAEVGASLDHPHILPVHEWGEDPVAGPYLVMPRVTGRTLRDVLDTGDRSGLAHAFRQVCAAVGHAHARGVVHRDLKPENILLADDGTVRVVDWGVARAPTGGARPRVIGPHTVDGAMVGTPGYIAPEQAEGDRHAVGARSDVWSLGAVLYELLTGERAYPQADSEDRLLAVLEGPPPDPQGPGVDEDGAAVCRRAMATWPSDRYSDAGDLGGAVAGWLEGRARRERAAARMAEGEAALVSLAELDAAVVMAEREVPRLRRAASDWAPLEDPAKQAWHGAVDRLAELRIGRAEALETAIAAGEGALSLDPGSGGAQRFLAELYAGRLEDAERRRDPADGAFYRRRLVAYDSDGRWTRRLAAPGRLTLHSTPPGARVVGRPVQRTGVVWTLGAAVALGRTPLREVALPLGSWILELSHPDRAPCTYPVMVQRDRPWSGPPVDLLPEAVPGWCYVPGGPYVAEGDPNTMDPHDPEWRSEAGFLAAELPVTCAEYAAFLDSLGAEEAWARSPREKDGAGGGAPHFWPRPTAGEGWAVPDVDRDGDRWDPRWAVCGVSWHDAMAFARWRSAVEGLDVRVITEGQYEKAARGVDGRHFPWGDRFDAALCHTRNSLRGRPMPQPVGSFATDRSVFGVGDLAGGTRTWCADAAFSGDPSRRPIRGGTWTAMARISRAANRFAVEPHAAFSYLGFRLVKPLEDAYAPGTL